jgi:hypothetical protein
VSVCMRKREGERGARVHRPSAAWPQLAAAAAAAVSLALRCLPGICHAIAHLCVCVLSVVRVFVFGQWCLCLCVCVVNDVSVCVSSCVCVFMCVFPVVC